MLIDTHCHVIATDTKRYPLAPLYGRQSDWSAEHPLDYPDSYVARRFEVDGDGPVPTQSIIIMDSLDDLRDVLAFQMPGGPMAGHAPLRSDGKWQLWRLAGPDLGQRRTAGEVTANRKEIARRVHDRIPHQRGLGGRCRGQDERPAIAPGGENHRQGATDGAQFAGER